MLFLISCYMRNAYNHCSLQFYEICLFSMLLYPFTKSSNPFGNSCGDIMISNRQLVVSSLKLFEPDKPTCISPSVSFSSKLAVSVAFSILVAPIDAIAISGTCTSPFVTNPSLSSVGYSTLTVLGTNTCRSDVSSPVEDFLSKNLSSISPLLFSNESAASLTALCMASTNDLKLVIASVFIRLKLLTAVRWNSLMPHQFIVLLHSPLHQRFAVPIHCHHTVTFRTLEPLALQQGMYIEWNTSITVGT